MFVVTITTILGILFPIYGVLYYCVIEPWANYGHYTKEEEKKIDKHPKFWKFCQKWEHFWDCHETLTITSIVIWLIFFCWMVVNVGIFLFSYPTVAGDNQSLKATQESLIYQLENKMYTYQNGELDAIADAEGDNTINVAINYSALKSLLNDVESYNSKVASRRAMSANPWIGWYYPDYTHGVELIELSKYSVGTQEVNISDGPEFTIY